MKFTKVIAVVFSHFSCINKYFLHKIGHSFLFAGNFGEAKILSLYGFRSGFLVTLNLVVTFFH